MGSEIDILEGRLTSLLHQLQSECGILNRMIYKNKNQHRRCSYFQYLLKVRRDVRLLQLANLEEIVRSCFLVIRGDRPKQKVHLLESLKRRKCDGEKYNFMERLLGVARLLAQMVEPMLKAATEVSVLFARSFFMGFSLTIMALLARLRVLVQQILLDVISLFNMVSSLSQKKQSVKITQDGIEVFREFYPISYDFVTLECVWESDKFVLLEKKHKIENASATKEDCEGNVYSQASAVNYESIETFLDDPPASEKVDAESAVKEGPSSVKDINTDSLMASSGIEEDKDIEGGEKEGENLGIIAVPSEELPPEGGLHALSQPSPSGKLDSGSKKVAFVSIKNLTSISQSVNSLSPCSANVKAAHFMESETNNDKEETLASILSEGIAKDSLF